MSGHAGQHNQHQHVGKDVAEISFAVPAEIGDRLRKNQQSVPDTFLGFRIILYFCGIIERLGANEGLLVKWFDYVHNCLFMYP